MAAGGAAAAAAMAHAIAASGGLVRLEPEDFLAILDRSENPLVVYANFWVPFWFGGRHQYLTPYRGLTFVTRSADELWLPKGVELIRAKSLFVPV
jgi:hypothetical protein